MKVSIPPESSLTPCRDCGHEVSAGAVTCPHCGAPRPARKTWDGEGYEWKSAASFRGWPMVHVAFGIDRAGKVRVARGVIAVGQRAVGGLAVGILALGLVSCGVVCGGVISCGVLAVGLALALGVNAVAPLAFGVVAVGLVVGGVEGVGWKILFSAQPGLR